MKEDRLIFLFQRAVANRTSPEEQEELLVLLADPENAGKAQELLKAAWSSYVPGNPVFDEGTGNTMLSKILGQISTSPEEPMPEKTRPQLWLSSFTRIAALLLLGSLIAGYFVLKNASKKTVDKEMTLSEAVGANQILPGSQKAVLKLDDGRSVSLSGTQKAVVVNKGKVQYEDGTSVIDSGARFYTVTTPKGGEYQIVLPDGSRVHLNAASSLRYPARFSKEKREVELEGEAFFEVTATPKYPFYVKSGRQETAALGTSFNIDAYKPNVTATTLVEGSLFIKNPQGPKLMLMRGKTAINYQDQDKMLMYPADLDAILAWHHGYFMFNDEPIGTIMEKVSRWYNVEVDYQGDILGKKFGGFFRRSKSLDALLVNFKETGIIDFKLEGRRLMVIAE